MDNLKSIFEVLSETEEGTLYVIFDQVQHPEANEFWQTMRLRPDVEWCYLWQDSQYMQYQDASPVLITIADGNLGESLLYWLNDYTEHYERLGIVGRYNGRLKHIYQHWRNWLSVLYPDGQEALLRFYDPMVITSFYSVLSDLQKVAFKGEQTSQRSDEWSPGGRSGARRHLAINPLPDDADPESIQPVFLPREVRFTDRHAA